MRRKIRLKRKRLIGLWNRYYPSWKNVPRISFRSRFSNRPLTYEELKRR